MKKLVIPILCILLVISEAFTQNSVTVDISNNKQSTFTKIGREFLNNGKFYDAIAVINQAPKDQLSNNDLLIRSIAYYHTAQHQAAYIDLINLMESRPENPYAFKYLGLTLHSLGYYAEAAENYKIYLSRINEKEKDFALFVDEVKRCGINLTFPNTDPLGFVENMGKSVNSPFDEVLPRQSPNFISKYYFSSNRIGSTGGLRNNEGLLDEKKGQYKFDQFSVELMNGNWTPVFVFNSLQNTAKNEYLQSFDTNGDILYFLQSDHNNSNTTLLVDTFSADPEKRAFPKSVTNGFRPDIGDKDLQVFNDSLWVFASKRKGGFGGYDIYTMQSVDGVWQLPVNMGDKINGAYNEETPYLTKGSKLLFYSSNRKEGLGGYDLFYNAYHSANKEWQLSSNLGAPINSPADDRDIFITNDGTQALFSSNRSGGAGGFDIYLTYLKEQILDQLEFVELPYFATADDKMVTPTLPIIPAIVDVTAAPDTEKNLPKRELINSPLLLSIGNNEISPQGAITLKNIKEFMTIYPRLEVTMLVSNSNENLAEFSLFNTAKIGEKAASLIANERVSKSRIHIIGLGSNFPIVDPDEIGAASKFNNRVSFIFHNPYSDNLKILSDEPTINSDLIDARYAKWSKSMRGLSYAVRFASTDQMLKSDLVKTEKQVFIVKNANDLKYTYNVGMYTTYNDARAFKNEALRAGQIEAVIIPYLYGKQISKTEVQNYTTAFSDLLEYLKYEKE